MVTTGSITILLGSIPLCTINSFGIADSDSKYKTPPSEFVSKNCLTIPSAKYVFPVAVSPARAVILLEGSPPNRLPERRALNK